MKDYSDNAAVQPLGDRTWYLQEDHRARDLRLELARAGARGLGQHHSERKYNDLLYINIQSKRSLYLGTVWYFVYRASAVG